MKTVTSEYLEAFWTAAKAIVSTSSLFWRKSFLFTESGTFWRYIAAILWVSDGKVHDGETWRLQCAYLQEEGNQELDRQQQQCADRPWRAAAPVGEQPVAVFYPFGRPTPYAPRRTPHTIRPTTYTVHPTRYIPRSTPMVKREKVWLNFLSVFRTTPPDR
jgi:hypothetical protein